MTTIYTDKIKKMASAIIDEWRSRNWVDYLDDNYYFDKSTLAKKNWKTFDKELYVEAGRFEKNISDIIGYKVYREEVKTIIDQNTKIILEEIHSGSGLPTEVGSMIYMLAQYLLTWAPSDCYCERATRILSAFPKQGIVVGFVKKDVRGQIYVYRPSIPVLKVC